jgi:hypothetical protein
VATANITPSVPRIASDLSQVPTKELDRFIQNHLKPSPQFQEQVKRAIDSVVRCLRESCVHKPSRVSKVSCPVKVLWDALEKPQGEGTATAKVAQGSGTTLEGWFAGWL